MRKAQIYQNIVNNAVMLQGGVSIYRPEFPLGEGYYYIMLEIINNLTVGSASGAISEGELQIIRNVYFRSDRDGIIINANGRELFRDAESIFGQTPYKDAIAATTGVYRVQIPLIFANPILLRPNDLVLDTSRYKNLEMYITLGTLSDCFTSVGTASSVFNINITVVKSDGMLLPSEKPYAMPYIAGLPPINPSTTSYVDIERASDLAILQLMAFTTDPATPGLPYSGTVLGTTMTTLQIEDNFGFPVRNTPVSNLQQYEKLIRQVPTVQTGVYLIDFAKDGSILSAYPTGDKSKCQLNGIYNTGTTPQLTAMIRGYRNFKS